MNRLISRRSNNFNGVVKIVVTLIITTFCCFSNCLPDQAQSNKTKYAAHLVKPQSATPETRTSYRTETMGLVVDNRVRALAKGIHSSYVVSMQFNDLLYGPLQIPMTTKQASNEAVTPLGFKPIMVDQVQLHPEFEPVVTDHCLISEFLQALRHAYKMNGVTVSLATPSLRITFRQIGASRRDPLDIDINFAYLGPEFQSVLNKVPGYLAAQLHHKMQTLDGQVREVDFATTKVTNPRKIAQITQALKHVKPNAFSVYGSTSDTFGLRLLLRQGGSEEVVFVMDPSLKSRSGASVLPKPLNAYITGR